MKKKISYSIYLQSKSNSS